MPNPSIRSRPTYKPFELIRAARSHLIIAERAGSLPILTPRSWVDAPIELWTIAPVADAAAQNTGRGPTRHHFRSTSHLLARLSYRLAREYVGLHLYVIGTEPFIWDIVKLARDLGMDRDEYHLTQDGSEKRRVYCVHCRTFTENVSTTIVTCCGCGTSLQVRDHFSQRLAAFMGFRVDAEVPGEIPPIEEAYL